MAEHNTPVIKVSDHEWDYIHSVVTYIDRAIEQETTAVNASGSDPAITVKFEELVSSPSELASHPSEKILWLLKAIYEASGWTVTIDPERSIKLT